VIPIVGRVFWCPSVFDLGLIENAGKKLKGRGEGGRLFRPYSPRILGLAAGPCSGRQKDGKFPPSGRSGRPAGDVGGAVERGDQTGANLKGGLGNSGAVGAMTGRTAFGTGLAGRWRVVKWRSARQRL